MGARSGTIAGDDGQIGGGEIERKQFGRRHPTQGDVLVGMRRGTRGCEVTDERKHFDPHIAVVVSEDGKGARDDCLAAELFAELAKEGGGRSFAGVDLAAGEFPFEAEVFVRGALGHEDQAG